MNKRKLLVVLIVVLIVAFFAIVFYSEFFPQHTDESNTVTEVLNTLVTKPELPDSLTANKQAGQPIEECSVFFVTDTERVSAAVFSRESCIFCYSLTREELSALQENFDNDPGLTYQTIGLPGHPQEYQQLSFIADREKIKAVSEELARDPATNSVLLVKELPKETAANFSEIPEGEYWVKAFFTESMATRLYQSIQNPSAKSCAINQRVDIDGDVVGVYQVEVEVISMMYNLFLSNPDAKCVDYDATIILEPGKKKIPDNVL